MLSKSMGRASEPQDMRKRRTLREEAARIKSGLNKESSPEDASEVLFDSLVEGQQHIITLECDYNTSCSGVAV